MLAKRRRPTFRSFAALGLLLTLFTGFLALALAALMALVKLTKFLLPELGLGEIHIPEVSDFVTWLLTQMTTSTIAFLTALSLVLFGVAMILRQIVLAGLRD